MIKLLLGLAAFVGAAAIIASGYLPHPQLNRVLASIGEPYPHTYATWGVLKSLGALSVQTLVLWMIIEPNSYDRSWRRPLASALVLLMAGATALLFGGMHPSAPEIAHAQWSLAVIVLLFVLSPIEYFRSCSR